MQVFFSIRVNTFTAINEEYFQISRSTYLKEQVSVAVSAISSSKINC